MLFHAPEFIFGFLPVTLIGFFLIARFAPHRGAILWLVVASLVFYGWGTAAHVALIAGSVVVNYLIGLAIRRQRTQISADAGVTWLIAGIALNIAALGFFKYYNFAVTNLNALGGTDFTMRNVVLPLAISFFTLQQIAYLVDVRRGLADETSFLHYCLFVTFFPQLIAGPIVHHSEMLPQFRRESAFRFDSGDFAAGLTIFLLGLFKKAVIADNLAGLADPVFAAADSGADPSFFEAWAGTLAFSFQIYFDFSAYSDMAMGLARMVSIRLPLNFDSPYRATGIIEFWRRWHMTLSRFLRDYLYIPLGGNRRGPVRRHANLMATMLIGGLWHGAAWTFVIWGGLHGALLIVNHGWRALRHGGDAAPRRRPALVRIVAIAATFTTVSIVWVFFRAQTLDGAFAILAGMAGQNGAFLPSQLLDFVPVLNAIALPAVSLPLLGGGTILGFIELCGILFLAAAIVFPFPGMHRMTQRSRLLLLLPTVALALQAVLIGGGASEFIYFRF